MQICTALTYTAFSSWHKYLISPHSNVLMIDFSKSVSGNLSHQAQNASEWAHQLYGEVFIWLPRIFPFIAAIEF